jgi:hypothetical protein
MPGSLPPLSQLAVGLAFAVTLAVARVAGATDGVRIIDAHSHYTEADAEALDPAEIIARLDAAGVSRVVISGTPADLALRLHAVAPGRIVPFLGVYDSHLDKARWMHDERVPERAEAQLAEGAWAGIGELHLFAPDAGSPVLARLVRLADAQDLILMLHGDAEIIDRVFAIAPAVRVLWAHLGTDPEPGALAAVIERHAGRALWIDTSVRDPLIAPDGVLLPEWRGLLEAHPERFLVAVDAFSTNRWHRYGEVAAAIRRWTADLPEGLRDRLLFGNAQAMLSGARASEPSEDR